jgi:hypothetical protein
MRSPEPFLTTTLHGALTRVTARHESPETARMMESMRALTIGMSFVGLAVLALCLINRATPTNAMWLVLLSGSLVAAMASAVAIGDALHARRFGLRRETDTRLVIDIDRRSVVHGGRIYARGGVMRFTALPHRHGRHEERAERHKERLMPTTYRDAYQVWLQHGETFVLLASVSDERGAQAIVRRLQEVDEMVSRGGTKPETAVFGDRHQPA